MFHNPTLFPAVTKIIELLSTSSEAATILRPHLSNLRDELHGLPVKDNLLNQFNPQEIHNVANIGGIVDNHEDEVNLEERRLLQEAKESMTNMGALQYLEKLQSEYHLNTARLRQFSAVLAGKCGIETQSTQFKSLDGIYRWFDTNWEIIEPFTVGILIVNCEPK
ncbi:hypothetical protein TRFO_16160 [Tritrichomonas foetus]|uniref:Uncharacterized protein n=1 Tax=Tritrichomonas foetus TaxID=1144522 RepID=A0A1J4KQZ7_9EUKA|nr:hypothetical protein TRFO_16160 [Tritrichomonas foetus]|eukprot:OHT13705.1 hypothetical protein TRFO_16160 [Tritrichomonas foetus]